MESPLSETPSHHHRTLSNTERTTTERPKMYQRRLSSFDRNEYKRKMYNESNTFIVYDKTIITEIDTTTNPTNPTPPAASTITLVNTFGFSSPILSPTKIVDNNNERNEISEHEINERNGKEITEIFFKNLDNTPTNTKGNKEE